LWSSCATCVQKRKGYRRWRKAFGRIVQWGQPGAFDRWLEAAKGSEEAEPKGFAQGLIKDYEGVRAALTHEWSNWVDRGQINGLKFLKRQMHGRANVDLLKARFLHAA
jgi:transposase